MSDDVTMAALSGTDRERADQTRKAGCDVVLHYADLPQMQEIASGSGELSKLSASRFENARKRIADDPQSLNTTALLANSTNCLRRIAAWISTLKLSFTLHPFGRSGLARHYATRGCSRLGGLGAWRSNGQGSRACHLQSSNAHRPLRYRHPSSVSCVHRRTLLDGRSPFPLI